MTTELSVESVADQISRFVNSSSAKDIKELGKMLAKDHRTLQQSKMHMVVGFIESLEESYSSGWFDARNEQACKFSSKVVQSTDDLDRCFPLI